MEKEKLVHQGEVLMLLVKRSGLEGIEVAKSMDIHPSYLSRLYKSKSLTSKVKSKAALLLGVDASIFETGLGYDIPALQGIVEEPDEEFRALEAEVERLEEENRQLAEELLKEKAISEEFRKLLLQMAKR
ncbi:MAG: hypothetical protein FGM16_10725 [Flavobacterium sp.]|nr:hypothetical protein [Flavobacterium sp.]